MLDDILRVAVKLPFGPTSRKVLSLMVGQYSMKVGERRFER